MKTILLVKSNADLLEKRIKTFDVNMLYKACNYKSNDDFHHLTTYKHQEHEYFVYGKKNGKANNENKYDFPPPIDKELYFGTLCIFKKDQEGNVENLTNEEWNQVYEALFGGFEDIAGEDSSERSEDSSVYSDECYTNEGYLKDGFVVEDEELDEEDYIDE